MKIPIDFWKEAVRNATQYVVIIEDDVWFSEKIDLDIISSEMIKSNCHLLHLGGLNFKYTESFKNESINKFFNKLFTANKAIMNLIFENKYKIFSILCRLGFANNKLIPHYYNYMTVPFGFYNKTFWLYTWQNNKEKADENLLLKNTAAYVHNNRKNKNLICKMKNEILRITYLVSSIPDYHRYSINFNLFKLNNELNEAWYNDKIDSMHNFPEDLDLNDISSFISKNEEDYNIALYKKWAKTFTKRYLTIKE